MLKTVFSSSRAFILLSLVVWTSCLATVDGAALRINVGGSAIGKIGFLADLPIYLTSQPGSAIVAVPSVDTPSSWMPIYSSYRYAFTGNLEYKIPIQAGKYKVALLFAETWPKSQVKGARLFDVLINGQKRVTKLDVFAKVGADKPYYLAFKNIPSVDNAITITLARVPDAENPMLSGLVITGDNPSALVKTANGDKDNDPMTNAPPTPITTTSSNGDPKCSTGVFGMNKSTGQMACCEKVCGKCGGEKCHTFAPGKLCCISSIASSAPSCDSAPPPCVPSKQPNEDDVSDGDGSSSSPSCKEGILGGNPKGEVACCPSVCEKCGGPGCNKFAPGTICCIKPIVKQNKSCASNPPPCVPNSQSKTTALPQSDIPTCSKGILGWNKTQGKAACCPDECKTCGGANCGKLAPGLMCCISSIDKQGKSCATNDPPCVPDAGSPSTEAPPTLPPTITNSDPNEVPQGSCPISGASKTSFSFNAGGGVVPGAIMGADNINYITSQSQGDVLFLPPLKISAPDGPKPWDAAYSSHRYTLASVLSYSIPVPEGTYTVQLLFAEIYFEAKGERMFDVIVNGVVKKSNLDVFAEVGKNKGLFLSFSGVPSISNKITVSVVKAVENPMISAIIIKGKGAGDLAKGGGCESATTNGNTNVLNSGFNHRAHAVPGGPYIATDFAKVGKAFVSLDGTQSHSHFSDPGPPPVTGKIVSYKWTWNEVVKGKSVSMSNSDKSGKFTASFPLGQTAVNLEVVDNTGDVAKDKTIVEVKSSAENGAYCYFYDFKDALHTTIPIHEKVDSDPKPLYGEPFATINFNQDNLSKIKFTKNSFAIRCVFFITIKSIAKVSYTVTHNGPFKLFYKEGLIASSVSKGKTSTPPTSFTPGLHSFQLHYFRPKSLPPLLQLSHDNQIMPATILQHDSAITLPVIIGLSKDQSAPTGGENIQIYGSGFINGVSVKFGNIEAKNLISSGPGMLQITVPPGIGQVLITVSTNAGTSNEFPFTYTSADTLDQPVIFQKKYLIGKDGKTLDISFVASVIYGPDRRLYLGGTKGTITALTLDKDLKVQTLCERSLHPTRAILGLAFKPTSTSLQMYFSSSTLYWKDFNLMPFEEGWTNGKIQTITWSSQHLEDSAGKSCAGSVSDVITGLPVSNHDHGVNKLMFMPNGELLMSIGSFTNGGLSTPGKKPVDGDAEDDALGGVASNPLSAALVTCPVNKLIQIKYDNYAEPEKAKIIAGNECSLYATGIRNSFGMILHTNGQLYVMDNGPNAGFGDFTVDCDKDTKPAQNVPDKFFVVKKGKYHGHPNLNRKECVFYPSSAVQPLISNVKSSTAGILEYRSNTFGGQIKGNVYLSMFAAQFEGQLGQVILSNDGKSVVSFAPVFLDFSGVAVAEGPRGEIIMARVYKNFVVVAHPTYAAPKVTFLLGVHPKLGPAKGGATVLISGFNFGSNPKVTFGGKSCTNVKVIDDQSFTCTTPANSKNTQVPVVVAGKAGSSPTYGSDYWYW